MPDFNHITIESNIKSCKQKKNVRIPLNSQRALYGKIHCKILNLLMAKPTILQHCSNKQIQLYDKFMSKCKK